MTVAELINELRRLPGDAEVGVLSVTAHARPPEVQRVNKYAGWNNGVSAAFGFSNPAHAFLIRPAKDIV